MAKSLSQQTVRAFALIGARARLESLRNEMQALIESFPELGGKGGGRGRGAQGDAAGQAPARRRRRRKMSAEQKKAVSERMRKYWAGRRKEKTK